VEVEEEPVHKVLMVLKELQAHKVMMVLKEPMVL
tara:strand:+ start:70 stop:171 length:102 start_codon:yes stop_codon:yes gene_type:complete